MKKRALAWVLAICMAWALCACTGGESTEPTEPPAPPVQEVTPPPENTSNDVSEPDISELDTAPEPVEPAEPEKLEGLIFLKPSAIKPTAFYNSYIMAGISVTRDIYTFNPETGKETLISSFTSPSPSPNGDYFADANSVRLGKNMFSSDYTKMALTKFFGSNGEYHAGWIDTDGNFFDVTEALGLQSKSDFDDKAEYASEGFSGDMFGFWQRVGTYEVKHYYVPVDNVTPGAVKEGEVHEVNRPFNEHGMLLNSRKSSELYGKYSAEEITSWIDDTRCIVNADNTGFDSWNSYIVDTAAQTESTYIPGESRNNWNGVISPDGTKIAFMSAPRSGTGKVTDIYTIPVNGGDPVKITGYSFMLADVDLSVEGKSLTQSGYILIDWK